MAQYFIFAIHKTFKFKIKSNFNIIFAIFLYILDIHLKLIYYNPLYTNLVWLGDMT